MKNPIQTVVRLLFMIPAAIPFAAASAQQGVPPMLQGGIPIVGSLTRARVGSPAQWAAQDAAAQARGKRANTEISRGEDLMKDGNPDAAIDVFQQVLTDEPEDGLAYQRLAEAQTAAGKLNEAADSYRTVLYHWPGKNWGNVQNGDPAIHMQFALLLMRLNKGAEALSVYQHGYQLLQSETAGSENTAASTLLPAMLASPHFTPAQLEAAADTVTAIHKYNWVSQSLSLADFQRVLKSQQDSAVAHFYAGQIYKNQAGHAADAVKEFQKAAQLGGPEMQPFVEKAWKEGPREFTILRPVAP